MDHSLSECYGFGPLDDDVRRGSRSGGGGRVNGRGSAAAGRTAGRAAGMADGVGGTRRTTANR